MLAYLLDERAYALYLALPYGDPPGNVSGLYVHWRCCLMEIAHYDKMIDGADDFFL